MDNASMAVNPWLVTGAVLSALAAILHVAIIVGGGDWYRFFGAGEELARMAEAGNRYPALLTACIALVLVVWQFYALAGAGCTMVPALPWTKAALTIITTIYLVRGLAPLPFWLLAPAKLTAFGLWSSLICSGYGLVHLIGLRQVWDRL